MTTTTNEEFSFLPRETYKVQLANRNLFYNGDFANWTTGVEGGPSPSVNTNNFTTSMVEIANGWSVQSATDCVTSGLCVNTRVPVPVAFGGNPPVYYLSFYKTGTADFVKLIQNIPDVNLLSEKQITLSFYMKSTIDVTPTIEVGIYYPLTNTFTSAITVNGALSPATSDNVMTKQEITINVPKYIVPVVAANQLPNNPNCYTSVRIYPQGTSPSWTGTVYLARAQLEYGPRATSFEHRPWEGKFPTPPLTSNDLTPANTKFVKDVVATVSAVTGDASALMNEALSIEYDHQYNISHTVVPGSYLASRGVASPADLRHTASSIKFVPIGGLSSVEVQSALAELDSEKATKNSGVLESLVLSNGTTATTQPNTDNSTLVATTAFARSVATGGVSMEDVLIALSNLQNNGWAALDTGWKTLFTASSTWGTGSGFNPEANDTIVPHWYDSINYSNRSLAAGGQDFPRNFTPFLHTGVTTYLPASPSTPYPTPSTSRTFVNLTTTKTLNVAISVDVWYVTDDGVNIMFFSQDAGAAVNIPTYTSISSGSNNVNLPAYTSGSPTVLQLLPGTSLTTSSGRYPYTTQATFTTFTLDNILIGPGKQKVLYATGMINGGNTGGGGDRIFVNSFRYKVNSWT